MPSNADATGLVFLPRLDQAMMLRELLAALLGEIEQSMEDVCGVLPHTRSEPIQPCRGLGHEDGEAQGPDRPHPRALQVEHVAIAARLWVGGRILEVFDHVGRELLLAELRLPVVRIVL